MADILDINAGRLRARVSRQCGAVVDAYLNDLPFLRPFAGDPHTPFEPVKAASFPMVPFASRVGENTFTYDGRDYRLEPNTDFDRHYLHGDGWLQEWAVEDKAGDSLTLSFEHAAGSASPYSYRAQQIITVDGHALTLALSVTNCGTVAMPFGLGHHPYFPMTPETTLCARAQRYWTEKHDYLPGLLEPIPSELDFSTPKPLPARWIDNGFEGWDGNAEISWPDRGLKAMIRAEAPLNRFFLFRSDAEFDPAYKADHFCFEPMSHTANGHNLADGGGLARLHPDETLSSRMSIIPTVFT
jgi:aldose 1-epimerase